MTRVRDLLRSREVIPVSIWHGEHSRAVIRSGFTENGTYTYPDKNIIEERPV